MWSHRGSILSWVLFFFVLFLLQLLFLNSQLSTVTLPNVENEDAERQLTLKEDRYELDFQNQNLSQRLNFTKLDVNALRHLFNGILVEKLRPPDATYSFNVSRSDEIPLDRDIIDTRPASCSSIIYSTPEGITTSVIIVFHNEALSILLRTVHSIIKRSPKKFLKEVILVDDRSTVVDLGEPLETYIRALDSRVHILRNEQRQGLVRSRIRGADNASGDILVWLDAHTECNVGWLEPLLHELTNSKDTIVQPHVDIISPDTIDFYTFPGEPFRGGFGWDLRYSWFKLPKYLSQSLTGDADPFPTPVLVGCAMAVRKDYFDATGQFDDGLNIWGGEHFDISFRTWLCGGRIITVPCSRVGHMFKENKYGFGGDRATVIRKNLMRVADIWLDEYKWIFDSISLSFGPDPLVTQEEVRSRIKRKSLRKKLKCKPFRWFLENIMPEIKVPSINDTYFGELTSSKTDQCWEPLRDGYIGMTGECFKHRLIPENHFSLDDRNRLVHDGSCIYMNETTWLLRKLECHCIPDHHGGQWRFLTSGINYGQLAYQDNYGSIWCAKHVTNVTPVHYGKQMVQMGKCNTKDSYQMWTFTYKLNNK